MKKTTLLFSLLAFLIAFFVPFNLSAAAGAPCGNYLSEDGLTKGECKEAYVDASDKPHYREGHRSI